MEPVSLLGLTSAEFLAEARRRLPRGHGFAAAVYRHSLRSGRLEVPDERASEAVRDGYAHHFRLSLPEVANVHHEEGPGGITAKAVLRRPDGLEYESVYLPMGRGRATLCISSQVGCKMGCTFCETGRMGLLRQLSAEEIVGQLLVARHRLGLAFRNVVFMGMGEALDNAPAVIQALRILTDPIGLSVSQERITVCTVGHVAGLAQLRSAGFKRLNLSVSLNSTTDAQRSEMMPVNRKTPLAELQAALVAYRPRANFVFGINYCLLPGINDSPEDAARIADFCAPLGRVMVNLIPYNPGSDPVAPVPSEEGVEQFVGHLRDVGLPVRRRITKGRTVMAACGQLGNVELRRSVRDRRRRLAPLEP